MARDDLKKEALRCWREYGETIVRAFGFPPGTRIVEDNLSRVFSSDDAAVEGFIAYINAQSAELRDAKFVGEK